MSVYECVCVCVRRYTCPCDRERSRTITWPCESGGLSTSGQEVSPALHRSHASDKNLPPNSNTRKDDGSGLVPIPPALTVISSFFSEQRAFRRSLKSEWLLCLGGRRRRRHHDRGRTDWPIPFKLESILVHRSGQNPIENGHDRSTDHLIWWP